MNSDDASLDSSQNVIGRQVLLANKKSFINLKSLNYYSASLTTVINNAICENRRTVRNKFAIDKPSQRAD